jgi:class 3 adenylate cyclase
LVRYDPRGIGLSQRDVEDFSLEAATRDLLAVVEATGFERVSIFAPCQGTLDAVAFAARYPARVERLILYSAIASAPRGAARDAAGLIAQLWRTSPRVAIQTWTDSVDRGAYPDLCAQLATMISQSVNSHDAAARIEQFLLYDVTDLLPQVEARTLVIHRRGDRGNSIALAQRISARIPGSKLVTLEGGAHWYAKDPASIIAAARSFLSDESTTVRPVAQAGALRIVLFTDIVGHTDMMQRLGDSKGRDVLREHERITRDLLRTHGGAEVKTMGDGFMASFGSVTSALDCAIALQRAFDGALSPASGRPSRTGGEGRGDGERVDIRIGLNAGEPIEEDGDLFGSTVILASRITAKAGAGEILIPEPVRHLLSGKSFVFSDRGEFAMKGFDDAVRLYEVRWRE